MADVNGDEPLLWTAAKAVAEERQHGCHYAEGACPECLAIAERVLRSIITEEPSPAAIEQMARRHSPRAWDAIDNSTALSPLKKSWSWASRVAEIHAMTAAYRAMPVWRALW